MIKKKNTKLLSSRWISGFLLCGVGRIVHLGICLQVVKLFYFIFLILFVFNCETYYFYIIS